MNPYLSLLNNIIGLLPELVNEIYQYSLQDYCSKCNRCFLRQLGCLRCLKKNDATLIYHSDDNLADNLVVTNWLHFEKIQFSPHDSEMQKEILKYLKNELCYFTVRRLSCNKTGFSLQFVLIDDDRGWFRWRCLIYLSK